LVPANPVDHAVARGYIKQVAQLVGVGEAPARLAEATQQGDPDRLENIGRIELGSEQGGQLSADRLTQVRLILDEDALCGGGVAVA
jgi:hypothetical protein